MAIIDGIIKDAGNHLLRGFHELLPAITAKNIVILGMKGAGKTTLWNRLGGIKEVRSNTRIELIPSFIFQLGNGRRVRVVYENEKYGEKKNGGVDIGGEGSYTAKYEDLIVPKSFVYYIADATKILEYNYYRKIRSDFRKIDSVLNNKRIKEKQFGFKVLLSHYDEWEKLHPESGHIELFDSFFDKTNGMKPDGPVRRHICEKEYGYLKAVNLLNDNNIELIKEEMSKV